MSPRRPLSCPAGWHVSTSRRRSATAAPRGWSPSPRRITGCFGYTPLRTATAGLLGCSPMRCCVGRGSARRCGPSRGCLPGSGPLHAGPAVAGGFGPTCSGVRSSRSSWRRSDGRVAPLLERAVLFGEVPRGDVAGLVDTAERQGRRLLAPLVERGLVVSLVVV